LLFSGILTFGQAPEFGWVKQMGGASVEVGNAIVTDNAGNVYTTGNFDQTGDFDPGDGVYNLTGAQGIFISKLDAFGDFVWAKSISGDMPIESNSIKVDHFGYVYITGVFIGTADFDPGAGIFNLTSNASGLDIFVLKLDAAGNFVWVKSIGGIYYDAAYSIEIDLSGNVYTSGYFADVVDFDPGIGTYNLTAVGFNDIFISKLDASGNFLWAKAIGGTGEGRSIETDASGAVYIQGSFSDTTDFDPGSGVYYLPCPSGYSRSFILKLDSIGNFLWAKDIAPINYPFFPQDRISISLDNSGNVYSVGSYSGTIDIDPGPGVYNLISTIIPLSSDAFILKLDSSGNFVWAKNILGVWSEYIASVVVDASENVYLAGYFDETADFDPGVGIYNLTSAGYGSDIFVSKLDASGNFLWAKGIKGISAFDRGNAITLDVSGNIYTTGCFWETTDFGSLSVSYPFVGEETRLTSSGLGDVFIYKISQKKNNLLENEILVYPNPTINYFTIEINGTALISIVNVLGQELLNFELQKSGTIDVSFLANGIYFVKDLENGGSVKFVKQ